MLKSVIKHRAADLLAATLGLQPTLAVRTEVLKTEGLDHAYGLLQDQLSRDLFVSLLAYRILGPRRVRLPLDSPAYWERRRSLSKYIERRGTITNVAFAGSLDLCKVAGLRLHAHPLNVWNTFLLEQYRCPRAGVGVGVGGVVVDGGGCWGDTALYFAQTAARVYCFECMPANIDILQKNLDLNPALSAKINVVQKALWSRSAEELIFEDIGPGSRAAAGARGVKVVTQNIDDFVATKPLDRIDFIKMDIEGAELHALIGAERTVRRFRPKLAISVYHELSHLASIPNWLDNLDLGYRFFLDHFTTYNEETVLFARADS